MIQADNLSIIYNGVPIFEDASFTIGDGERCGLVGRNGSGKTTLFRLLAGLEEPDQGAISLSKGYKLGYLDQHIKFSRPTVLEEGILGLKEDERENVYLVEMLLSGLGFSEEQFDVSPELLSGGYHLRLHLAKVLLSEPDCLLLDEPTNYLDILSIRFLTQVLRKWKGELVLISHDREFMDQITTHTMGIHRKKIQKFAGGTVDFFNQILTQEEIHEKTRVSQEKKRTHLQTYIDRFGAKASKAAQAQSKRKMLERIPVLEELKRLYSLDFSFPEKPFPGQKMAEVKEVSFRYEKDKELISKLSLAIEKGERIAIIGKNGYGKSTILKLLASELAPNHGTVSYAEQTAIGYFGQTHIQRLTDARTIEEEIGEANPTLNFSNVRRICGLMMFSGDLAKKKISVLSGGEKSRVLLGKILAKPCNLLLLDEPTHHLDMESIEALIDALEDFEGAVVLVTHSELILKRLQLDKIVVCHYARQNLFLGNYEDFLEKLGWEEEEKPSSPKKSVPKERTDKKALEKEIQRLEKTLKELETTHQKEQELLMAASEKKDFTALQTLSKKALEREKEIQKLSEQLLNLYEQA